MRLPEYCIVLHVRREINCYTYSTVQYIQCGQGLVLWIDLQHALLWRIKANCSSVKGLKLLTGTLPIFGQVCVDEEVQLQSRDMYKKSTVAVFLDKLGIMLQYALLYRLRTSTFQPPCQEYANCLKSNNSQFPRTFRCSNYHTHWLLYCTSGIIMRAAQQ